MTQYLDTLGKSPLFSRMDKQGITDVLTCLRARLKPYAKGEFLLLSGDSVPELGIVLSGGVQIEREDANGVRTIIAKIERGELFAESFACAGTLHSPVSVAAAEACEVLWLPATGIVSVCPRGCAHHSMLVENMMHLLARKNLLMHERLELLSKKTIRERITTYLGMQSRRQGSARFIIPFSRTELADYLCVDRSALSRELGAMRDEGLVRFHLSEFELL